MAEQTTNAATLPTVETVAEQLNGILARLRFATKRIAGDDVFKRSLETLIDEVVSIGQEIELMMDAEAIAYNSLVEDCETLQTRLNEAFGKIDLFNVEQADKERRCSDAIEETAQIILEAQQKAQNAIDQITIDRDKWHAAYEAQESQNKALKSKNRSQEIELRALQLLEPEKLKKKLHDERVKTRELTETKGALQTKLNQSQRELVGLKTYVAKIEARNAVLGEDLDLMRDQMNLADGDHCVQGMKFFSPVNPTMVFYPHIFYFDMEVNAQNAYAYDGIRFINNLGFHVMTRTNTGWGLTYLVTEMGIPICITPKELEEHWPAEMDDFLEGFYLDQIERVNPHLHSRCVWAHEYSVLDVELLDVELREKLFAAGITNLAKLGSTYAHTMKIQANVTDEECARIKPVIRELVNQWDKANGQPDIERKKSAEKQKIVDRRVDDKTAELMKRNQNRDFTLEQGECAA